MKKLTIKRIDNIEEAKEVWDKLSPDKVLCDNWDFRYCFYKYFNHPLYFYAGSDNGETVGLLPLQYNEQKKRLQFFGSDLRDNRVFILPGYEECIPQFYDAIPRFAELFNIVGEDPFTMKMGVRRYKYIGGLSGVRNTNDYFDKNFSAKSRYGLKKKIKLIQSKNPQVITNDFNDIDLMMDLNRRSFGDKSLFSLPYWSDIYHDILKLNLDFHIFSYVIDGKKEAASFSIKYKDTYVYINSGTNKEGVPNLGTFNIYYNFEKAIEVGAKSFDAGLNDLGWKERWHLEKVPQRYYKK